MSWDRRNKSGGNKRSSSQKRTLPTFLIITILLLGFLSTPWGSKNVSAALPSAPLPDAEIEVKKGDNYSTSSTGTIPVPTVLYDANTHELTIIMQQSWLYGELKLLNVDSDLKVVIDLDDGSVTATTVNGAGLWFLGFDVENFFGTGPHPFAGLIVKVGSFGPYDTVRVRFRWWGDAWKFIKGEGPISMVLWGEAICLGEWCMFPDEPGYSCIWPDLSWRNVPRGDADMNGVYEPEKDGAYIVDAAWGELPPTAAADTNNDGVIDLWDLSGNTPGSGPLPVYGNADMSDDIDMADVTYIKLIMFGKKPATLYADANHDGRISMLDVVQTKLIIEQKAGQLTFVDLKGDVVTCSLPYDG